jgi:hypothetical protein
MRQVWKFPLRATWRDIADVEMPKGAQVVHFAAEPVPTLWATVDPEQPAETRSFQVFGTGHDLPHGARHVGTYFSGPLVWHVFELVDSDVPADLPGDQARADYRLLLAEGYTPTQHFLRLDGPPRHSWKAPDDLPAGQHSYDAIVAIARLQEHGYGPVIE